MRVFLCSYAGFSVAIPMNSVASLILYKNTAEKTIEYDSKNSNTYISLPVLLRDKQSVIRHGIILKNGNNDETEDMFKNKTILLSTEVEYEEEIPAENIFPVPKVFSVFDFSVVFNGISFNSGKAPGSGRDVLLHAESLSLSPPAEVKHIILFLNPEEFLNNIEARLHSIRSAA